MNMVVPLNKWTWLYL